MDFTSPRSPRLHHSVTPSYRYRHSTGRGWSLEPSDSFTSRYPFSLYLRVSVSGTLVLSPSLSSVLSFLSLYLPTVSQTILTLCTVLTNPLVFPLTLSTVSNSPITLFSSSSLSFLFLSLSLFYMSYLCLDVFYLSQD